MPNSLIIMNFPIWCIVYFPRVLNKLESCLTGLHIMRPYFCSFGTHRQIWLARDDRVWKAPLIGWETSFGPKNSLFSSHPNLEGSAPIVEKPKSPLHNLPPLTPSVAKIDPVVEEEVPIDFVITEIAPLNSSADNRSRPPPGGGWEGEWERRWKGGEH